ncbi:Glu-tRNA(Gln) amidotransferase subunit GatD [Candidatus Marsarchaeota archaeon]|nr:Glu-tRNA(Gln) amidotransferase subunit GatD [Candidatus Marsarchaeota archaeon]MCL5099952.1 Glu-tRNA(Gln) amidotransferase subunit GatD [Candidatus Marsarchaeota archaeon]
MYQDKVSEFLKENGIAVGDTIKVERAGAVIEGELMPGTEANSPDVLVVKLKNGYNAGISLKGAKVKKLDGARKEARSFPKAQLKQSKGLPKVALLYTGGTIGSKLDYKTGGVYMLLKPEELFYEVPELSSIASVSAKQLFSISSEDMSYMEWQRIAEEAAKAVDEGAHGVVITIGTDTMHYASAALSFMLSDVKAPIVLTGSQRSSDRGSSDAFLNLICAVRLAAESDIGEVGICMHATSSDDKCAFMRGTKVRKMHTSRRDAFRPVNEKPIAELGSTGVIKYISKYRKAEQSKKAKALPGFEEKVALVKAYPDSSPDIINFYADKGYKGMIIEGTGLGHTPVSTEHEGKSWLPAIKSAVENGMVIGMTSQCLYGRVHPNVYRNLRLLSASGVIYCEDMLPETAYAKLGWLLGNYDAKKAKELLSKNLVGEIAERREHDEFPNDVFE